MTILSHTFNQDFTPRILLIDIDGPVITRRQRRVRPIVVVRSSCRRFPMNCFSIRVDSSLLALRLAASIPSIINQEYCTKDNCTNQTFSDHLRQATAAVPEEAVEEEVERSCDTLFMCIVTTLNKGLRNGGGIGDVLRQPSSQVSV